MKQFILLLALFFSCFIQAQFNISGVIVDVTTQNTIPNVSVTNIDSGETIRTDINGKFGMEQVTKLLISAPNYKTKEVTLIRNGEIIIELLPLTTNLEEVVINSQAIPIAQKYATDAVSVLNKTDLTRGNSAELHPVLNRTTGVFMQSGTWNTNRITIRGIGARNLFGTANIRTFFGDIPLTDGNGESAIEDLELSSLSSMEIHKGPSSSSYGVGLGGAIILKPENMIKGTKGKFGSSFGSFGLLKNIITLAHGNQKSNVNIIVSNLQSDGYRKNNEYDRQTVTITSEIELNPKNTLTLLGSYIHLKAGIPSSLNFEDYNQNPRQAAFTWGRAQAFEHVDYGIFGVTWKHTFSANISQHTSIFSSFRNNYEPRPFNILEEKSNTIGIRSRTLGNIKMFEKEMQWTAGGELFLDFYTGKTFENLYEDFPVGTGSVKGDPLSNLDEKRNYYNLFAEINYQLLSKLRIHTGLHLNQTFFNIEDRFLSDSDDSSGNFEFAPILSPKIGFNYVINPHVILFGNISHGFSTPTTTETLLPEGEFNPDIKPEIGWNYELGTRFNFINNKVSGAFSLYTMRVRDLLVSRRTVEDNFFAINAGKTRHNGVEFDLDYSVLKNKKTQINISGNISVYNHTFQEFIDLDTDFSGNDLTGVPSSVWNIGIDLIQTKGWYGTLNFQSVGKIPANDANTVFSEAYELLHGKIGYTSFIGNRLRLDFYTGANNILDKKYVSQLQINARGFGGNAPRYFYPGLPFNAYGGINITYRL